MQKNGCLRTRAYDHYSYRCYHRKESGAHIFAPSSSKGVSCINGSAESHRPHVDLRNSAGTHPTPSAPPDVPLPSSPGEAPRRSPQNRQISSSSEKNSSSSSSAEPRFVKSTLYLSRPPMPPNPLTN